VRVKSLAGKPFKIVPGLLRSVHVTGSRDFLLENFGSGVYGIDLKAGEEAVLYSDKFSSFTIAPVET
jgi:hypothetical protein